MHQRNLLLPCLRCSIDLWNAGTDQSTWCNMSEDYIFHSHFIVNPRSWCWSSVKFPKLHHSSLYLQNIQADTKKVFCTHINLVWNLFLSRTETPNLWFHLFMEEFCANPYVSWCRSLLYSLLCLHCHMVQSTQKVTTTCLLHSLCSRISMQYRM